MVLNYPFVYSIFSWCAKGINAEIPINITMTEHCFKCIFLPACGGRNTKKHDHILSGSLSSAICRSKA